MTVFIFFNIFSYYILLSTLTLRLLSTSPKSKDDIMWKKADVGVKMGGPLLMNLGCFQFTVNYCNNATSPGVT